MIENLLSVGLQAVLYLGAFSRFTHGQYTPAFYQYQLERAPDNESTKFIPFFDVLLGTTLFFPKARPWAALFCALAQGGGIFKLAGEGKDVRPDLGIFTHAMGLTFVAYIGDRWKYWRH